jgi:hypothetical protein
MAVLVSYIVNVPGTVVPFVLKYELVAAVDNRVGRATEVRFGQLKNARLPSEVTFFGMQTEVRRIELSNALLPIVVKLSGNAKS